MGNILSLLPQTGKYRMKTKYPEHLDPIKHTGFFYESEKTYYEGLKFLIKNWKTLSFSASISHYDWSIIGQEMDDHFN